MKKTIAILLTMILACALLAGCSGTPVVYYSNCTCPTGSHEETPETQEVPVVPLPDPTEGPAAYDGGLKTGLAVITKLDGSASAAVDAEGLAKYDVTLVAVTVDENGVIQSCLIDSIGTQVNFDQTGAITTDVSAAVASKNELGDAYGMKSRSTLGLEWYEQAAAFAKHAVGKTVEQLKTVSVNESGYAADAELASSASIKLIPYVEGIEAAVNNAQYLGAQAGDELRLAAIASLSDSVAATAEAEGTAQLNVDVVALTMKGDIITSCYIDAVQAKVKFDQTGAITTDVSAAVASKNELGDAYGMKSRSALGLEWNEQAAYFAEYVTGKTADQVAGIAVDEAAKTTDVDLATRVTIAIGGFQKLIAKACG